MRKLSTPNKKIILFVCTFFLGLGMGWFVSLSRGRSAANQGFGYTPRYVIAEVKDGDGRTRLLLLERSGNQYFIASAGKQRILDKDGNCILFEGEDALIEGYQ